VEVEIVVVVVVVTALVAATYRPVTDKTPHGRGVPNRCAVDISDAATKRLMDIAEETSTVETITTSAIYAS